MRASAFARRWLVFFVFACVAGQSWTASASGFPDFDAARETVLLGRATPSASTITGEADTHGSWKQDGAVLTLPAEDKPRSRFWIAKGSEVATGLVRARLAPGTAMDAGILFRVSAGLDLRELSGYELSLSKDAVRLQRWDRGKALPVGAEVKIAKLQKHAQLEVVIFLVGPQILATVYDGETLDTLATLAAHETTYSAGRVGLRAGGKQDGMRFEFLSRMDTSVSAPAAKGSGKHGALKRYGLDADPGTTPFGNTRFVFIPQSAIKRLPRDLARAVQTRLRGDDGSKQAVVFTDAVGLERMRRRDIPILAFDSNVPFKTFDPDYRSASNAPPVATRRGFRLDLSYKNPDMVEALLRAYQAKYPDISRIVELGRTHRGRPILALKISDNPRDLEAEPGVLLNGSHHASELLSVEYPLDAAATLLEGYGRDREVTRWVDALEVFVVPLVNPDGNHMFLEESRFAGRKNARDTNMDGFADPFEGVDLNRNYFFGWGQTGSSGVRSSNYYRGPHPGSEPESWAMMTLADRQHFAASISFHTVGSALFVPYMVGDALPPRPHAAQVIAHELADAGLEQPNEKRIRVRPGGYPVAGSDQDWLMHRFGTVAYILEGSHHNPSLAVRAEAVEATRPIWKALLERVRTGPRISGRITDEAGNPLEAEVTVDEVELRMGERWASRPADGRYDRLLARPGRYTVRAKAAGFEPASQEIRVRTAVTVDLTLRPAA